MDFPRLRVAIFCGGRGSSTILRALLRNESPRVELTLLINAYDDGRSTGMLRKLIPGMPGPADFRKNLALLVASSPAAPSRLSTILEHRLARGAQRHDVEALCEGADVAHRPVLRDYVHRMFEYVERRGAQLTLDDCAVGNLVFAGAHLRHSRNFNCALAEIARSFGAPAQLLNIDDGEARVLVALKQSGELLDCEAAIVGAQSAAPITDLFLLANPLTAEDRRTLDGGSLAAKRGFLARLHRDAKPCGEALQALQDADLIVYGPGTQYSSLLPSYRVRGVAEAIDQSRARARVLFTNLREDHDMRGLGAAELVDRALGFLGDSSNARRRVSHVLHDVRTPAPTSQRNAQWLAADLEDPAMPGAHDGDRAAAALFSILASLPAAVAPAS